MVKTVEGLKRYNVLTVIQAHKTGQFCGPGLEVALLVNDAILDHCIGPELSNRLVQGARSLEHCQQSAPDIEPTLL